MKVYPFLQGESLVRRRNQRLGGPDEAIFLVRPLPYFFNSGTLKIVAFFLIVGHNIKLFLSEASQRDRPSCSLLQNPLTRTGWPLVPSG
jgi:hypothetical protein